MQAMGKYSHHLSVTQPAKRRLRKRKVVVAANDQCDEADPMPISKKPARLEPDPQQTEAELEDEIDSEAPAEANE